MEKLNYEEFKEKNEVDRIEELKKFWGIEEHFLKGKINFPNSGSRRYCFIRNVTDLKNNAVNNPFMPFSSLSVYCEENSKGKKLNSFDENEEVVFRFMVSDKEGKSKPLMTNSKNLLKLKELDEFNNESNSALIDKLKETIGKDPYVERVLFVKDFEEELSNMIQGVEENLFKYENSIIERKNDLKELNNELYGIYKEIDSKKEHSNILVNEIKEHEEKLKFIKGALETLGFSNEENKIELIKKGKVLSREEHINYIQKYLGVNYKKNLYYNLETLEQFYSALGTSQILILSGAPGTGKTSLVEGFCDAIGAVKKIVSVQPNWTDNQDLLGFYNPLEKVYVSTPFLDAIIEAKHNPDQLYVICLDEMNLAHVEYYFSEFLSKLQSNDRTLTLYSKYIYEKSKNEIINRIKDFIYIEDIEEISLEDKLNSIKKIDKDYYYKLKWQWEFINKYPAEIEIPRNIRFVGTINKDETTKDLSPKVIDRSYIMEVSTYESEIKEDMKNLKDKYEVEFSENLYLSAEDFNFQKIEINKDVLLYIEKIKSVLEKMNIKLNNRFYNQINELIASNIVSQDNMIDYIVSAKILPKINLHLSIENKEDIYELEKLIATLPISNKLFKNMKEFWEKHYILTYWR